MAGFKELIGNLEKTRSYFRDFFVYGFKTKDDFEKSNRTYEDEKRRAELLLKGHIVNNKAPDVVQKKIVAIPVDSGEILENPFYGIYYVNTFTDNDIKLHFAIIDILSDGEKHDIKDIADRLSGYYTRYLWKRSDLVGESTIRAKLGKYADEGIVRTETVNNKQYYSLSRDTLPEFIECYEGLADAVKFFSETQEFGIVGNYILKASGLRNDLFYMKHNYIIHTLEDEVISVIAEAVEKKCRVTYEQSGSRRSDRKEPKPQSCTVIPFMVMSSSQTGRRFLLHYDEKTRRFSTSRLDQIRKIRIQKPPVKDYDILAEKARKSLRKVFGVSFGDARQRNTSPVSIRIFADDEKEGYIVERLMREKRCGTVERTAENEYTVTLDVFDPYEILGWVKTFIGRIISIEGSFPGVSERLQNDVKRMYEMYGGKADETV